MSRTTITADTITDSQIRALRREAAAAGDMLQVAICDIAVGFTPDTPAATCDLSPADARAECARVIADAAAQQD